MHNDVLTSEVTATSDVFAKPNSEGTPLFNVIILAETESPITTEEGIKFVLDYTLESCPKLEVLFVSSAYNMHAHVHNHNIKYLITTVWISLRRKIKKQCIR